MFTFRWTWLPAIAVKEEKVVESKKDSPAELGKIIKKE